MNNYYVYMYLRENSSDRGESGTPYYIGKGKGPRVKTKQYRTAPIPTSSSNVVLVAKGMTEPDAFQAEMLLIHLHGRLDLGLGCLRNRTDGGEGISGFKHSVESKRKVWDNRSEESKYKLMNAHKHRVYTAEMRKALSDRAKGKSPSLETRGKQSKSLRGRKQTEEHKAKRITSRRSGAGWAVPNEETRKKMSEASKGKPKSESARANMKKAAKIRPLPPKFRENSRLARIGSKASPETREKMRMAHLGKKRGPYAPTRERLANLSKPLLLVDSEPFQQP